MANMWKRFLRITAPAAPRWIAEVIEETVPGQYLVAIVPTGSFLNVTGPQAQYANDERVLVQGTEIVDTAPRGDVVQIEV